jgi:hypothetical protein
MRRLILKFKDRTEHGRAAVGSEQLSCYREPSKDVQDRLAGELAIYKPAGDRADLAP